MAYESIRVESRFDGQVTEITLGPPPANIVTRKLIEELMAELERHTAPDLAHAKLIVLKGDGKHFSYGASVEEHQPEQIRDMLPTFHRLIAVMLEHPIPTLAAVRGLCLGGAFEVTLACSLVFCDEKATLGVPEIKLGVFPPVAAVLLPFTAGAPAASRIVLSGENCDAATLHRLGVVGTVVPAGELDAEVDRFIEAEVLDKSASSLRFANRAARSAMAAYFREYIPAAEKLYLDELMSTSDAVEGIESFLAKRKPTWKNA